MENSFADDLRDEILDTSQVKKPPGPEVGDSA
jgi:hypothetical protein